MDGASLYQTLALAAPAEGPLEGSGLGWLYNPVFVVDQNGTRQRAFAVFAAGGMAVLEDRFGAEDNFEFWMYQRQDLVGTLLAELAGLHVGNQPGAPPTTALSLKGPSREAFALALDMWRWQRAIGARHSALGHWPTSLEALQGLLAEAPEAPRVDAAAECEFIKTLRRLALRKFKADRTPA
jgi:hypothetical protein